MSRRAGWLALAAVLVVLPLAMGGPARADVGAPGPPAERRVLVISVPGLRWGDVQDGPVPTLRSLLEDSAVANLATRVTGRLTTAAEGYATLGAGTRAVAPPPFGGAAYDVAEPYGRGTAGEEYARQQGDVPEAGIVSLGWVSLERANGNTEFDATIGTLGQGLAAAGVDRGVVGNAREVDDLTAAVLPNRDVALGLSDVQGRVPCGSVGRDLLEEDVRAPYGARLDDTAVAAAVRRCATPGSVVLVEASDLRRAADFARTASPERGDAVWEAALASTDRLVGQLLADIDPDRDAVVVVAPTTANHRGLAVLGIRAEELPLGLLTSGNTRRPGYVLLTDVAPSIAQLAGVELDDADLEGRPVESRTGHGSGAQRIEELADGEAAAIFRDRLLNPAILVLVIGVGALALAAAAAFIFGWEPVTPWLARAALVMLAFPAVTYLAAPFPFHEWGAAAYWAFVLGAALALGTGASFVRRSWLGPLVAGHALLVGLVATSVVLLSSRLQQSTVFGDSPIIAGRFTGINNVTFSFFVLSGIVLACAVVEIEPGARGRRLAIGLLVALLIVDIAPMWGADVGGVLAGVPALAAVAIGLGRWRVRWRTVVLVAVGTVAVIGVLGLVDLTRDSADRSHLGRLFERIGSEGSGGLSTVVERKLSANLRTLTRSTWRYVFFPVGISAVLVAWKARERALTVARAFPALVAALPGLGLAALLGYALNDSGIALPAAMITSFVPTVVFLACRLPEEGT